MKAIITFLFGWLLLAMPSKAQDQFDYTTNADDTITITNYSGPGGDVIIPSTIDGLTVTSIGGFAFFEGGVTSITIPGSVATIGDYAFRDCYDLTNATLISGVSSIGEQAFFDCSALTTITVPDSVTNIGHSAFEYCSSLGSITIPGGVTSIGDAAFYDCSSLTNATIASGVTTIEDAAFYDCYALNNVVFPATLLNIDSFAFFGCSGLSNAFFAGNAPIADSTAFNSGFAVYHVTIYYLPNTIGWDSLSANTGLPIVLWNPLIQIGNGSFGVQNNQFGFNITGTTNIPIVVETSTNLANPVWSPLQALTLTNGLFYFTDPQWSNYPARYYRISAP